MHPDLTLDILKLEERTDWMRISLFGARSKTPSHFRATVRTISYLGMICNSARSLYD